MKVLRGAVSVTQYSCPQTYGLGIRVPLWAEDVMRVRHGKITEPWGVAHLFSLMQPLGAWPTATHA